MHVTVRQEVRMATRPPERRHSTERRQRLSPYLSSDLIRQDDAERRAATRREIDRCHETDDEAADDTGAAAAVERSRRIPTLLWQLTDGGNPAIECLALRLQSGRTLVDIAGRDNPLSSIFDDVPAAIRFAFALERSLIAHGWTKAL